MILRLSLHPLHPCILGIFCLCFLKEFLLVKILQDNGKDVDVATPTNMIGLEWSGLGMATGGKEKSIIIKDYIDGMEKIMKQYSKPLRSVLTDYTKKRTLDPDPDSGDVAMWDELVVNNFTIIKVHVGSEYGPDFEDPAVVDRFSKYFDKLGVSYQLWQDEGDMADYIARSV